MTAFTTSQRETLIWQLSISPSEIYLFDEALADLELSSQQFGIDWVAKAIELSEAIVVAESGTETGGGTDATIDPTNALTPILQLQTQGVKAFKTEEISIEFKDTAVAISDDAAKLRRQLLDLFSSFGYYFDGGGAKIYRS